MPPPLYQEEQIAIRLTVRGKGAEEILEADLRVHCGVAKINREDPSVSVSVIKETTQ